MDDKKRILRKYLKVEWVFGGEMEKAIYSAMEEYKNTQNITGKGMRKGIGDKYYEATKNKSCHLCGFFCNNVFHYNNWYDVVNPK